MGTTDYLDLPYPELSDSDNVPRDIQALADALEGRVITPVANTTERDTLEAAFVPAVGKPLFVFRADATAGQEIEYTEDGTTWRPLVAKTAYCELVASAATTSVGASAKKVDLATTVSNDTSAFTVSSSVVTIVEPSLYEIFSFAAMDDANSNTKEVGIFKNGLSVRLAADIVGSVTRLYASPSWCGPLAASDTIQLGVDASTSSTSTVHNSGAGYVSRLLIRKVG